MKKEDEKTGEVIVYWKIVVILITISILNNVFLKKFANRGGKNRY